MNGGSLSRYIIAGIDPGTATGIAILDLSGRKIALISISGGLGAAVSTIERHGTVSLVACDVSPAPGMARRISSFFSCKLYCPRKVIRENEKRAIAKGAGTKNSHERDAYCAALLGFREYANKLRQIDSLDGLGKEEKNKLKHMTLKGYRLHDAFLELKTPQKEKKPPLSKKPISAQRISQSTLEARVARLARENANLKIMLNRLEQEKALLEKRTRLLENGVRKSVLKDSELRKLRFRLKKSLERLGTGKKGKKKKKEDNLNRFEPKFDLEELVAEYREGKK